MDKMYSDMWGSWKEIQVQILCFESSLNSHRFSLIQETDIVISRAKISENFQAPNMCKIFSHERKYERVEKKFKTQNPIPRERICTPGTANVGSQDVTCAGTGLELEETCGSLKCPEPHCPDGYQYSSK